MTAAASAPVLERARGLLASLAGLALDERRDDALSLALQGLSARLGVTDAEALDLCERHHGPGGPLDALVRALLVRETHVFRTREHFDALENVVLPEILARRSGERRLRAWSAGCATGEEAWSLAFAVADAARGLGADLASWDVVLLGTDVDPDSLETARRGEYREYSFRGVTRAERARFFGPIGDAWRVRDPWRGMVTFRRHDLVREPPPAVVVPADLVLCRNVLMYFTAEAARQVLLGLVEALADGGWLLVGAAEHGLIGDLPLESHPMPDALAYRKAGARRAPSVAHAAPTIPAAALRGAPLGPAPSAEHAPANARQAWSLAKPAEPSLDAARAALVAGDRHQAAEMAVGCLEARPDDADACLFLGRLAADAGHVREAEAWLRRTLQARPGDADASYLLALVAFGGGDAAEAARRAGDAARARPGFVMALQLLGRARRLLGDEAGAASALGEALRELESLADDAPVPHAHDLPAAHLRSALKALSMPQAIRR